MAQGCECILRNDFIFALSSYYITRDNRMIVPWSFGPTIDYRLYFARDSAGKDARAVGGSLAHIPVVQPHKNMFYS